MAIAIKQDLKTKKKKQIYKQERDVKQTGRFLKCETEMHTTTLIKYNSCQFLSIY